LPVFWAFRMMVGTGILMLLASWFGLWRHWRDRWDFARMPRPMLKLYAAMTFIGWVATIAGLYVTEIGRQPFIVFGLIRTSDVASRVSSSSVALTLAIYVVVYLALLVAYVSVLKHMAETAEKKPYGIMPEGQAEGSKPYRGQGEFA
jgi:cytochrome d ubiquinol oxidase subunit I